MKRSRLILQLIVVLAIAALPFVSSRESHAATQTTADGLYRSPTYGYTVKWDTSLWQKSDESSANGSDLLRLGNGASDVFIQGWEGYDGDAPVCLADIVMQISTLDGVTGAHRSGDRYSASGTAHKASTVYEITRTYQGRNLDLAWSMSCQTLVRSQSVLVITWSTNDFAYEEQRQQVNDLLLGVKATASINVQVVDGNGVPLPDVCVREFDDANAGRCDDYDGESDGVILLPEVVAGQVGLEIENTPTGFDPHGGIFRTVAPAEEIAVVFQFVTGPARPETLPVSLCLPSSSPRLVAEVYDDNRKPWFRVYLTDLSLRFEDKARIDPPPDGARYVLADILLENISANPIAIDPTQFILFDDAYLLTPAVAHADRLLRDGSALASTSLAPGATSEGSLLFQVSASAGRPINLMYSPRADRLAPIVTFFWKNDEVVRCTG